MSLALCLVLLTAVPDAGPEVTFRLPADTKPMFYTLALDLDPKADSYSGTETIRVRLEKPRKTIWLHALGLQVSSATVGGKKAVFTQVDADGLAKLELEKPQGTGETDVVFAFKQKFNERLSSIHKVTADGAPYVFTQFESLSAREGFPCFDEPGFKTPYALTLTVSNDDVAVANTAEQSRKKVGAKTEVKFQTTQPLPTYLLAFAVGPFDVVPGPTLPPNGLRETPVPIRGIAVKGKGALLKDSVAVAGEALAALERYFGLAYPYGKMDIVAVPDFAAGAMENAGLVTFRDQMLFVDAKAPIAQQRQNIEGIAHEFAHQWFGDFVTLAWWDDIWLNEAFATFMEAEIVDDLRPAYRERFVRQEGADWVSKADSLVSARQIRQPVIDKGGIMSAFDGITYNKGAAVIAMFEQWMGKDAFKKGVRDYLVKHAHGTTTAKDLLDALTAAAGKDVATPFFTFLDQPGVPYVAANLVCDAKKKTAVVELKQERFLPIGSTGDRKKVWQVPVCVRADNAAECTLLTEATGALPLKSCPKVFHPNVDANGYYRWSLPAAQLKALAGARKVLTSGERLSFANALKAGFSTAALSYAEVLDAALPLAKDAEPAIAGTPLELLTFAKDALLEGPAQAKAAKKIAGTYQPVLDVLTLKPKPNEAPQVRDLRTLALTALVDEAEDAKTIAALAKLGRAVLGLDGDKKMHLDAAPSDQVELAIGAAIALGGDTVFDDVVKRLETESDSATRGWMLAGLGSVHDARSVKALALTLDPRLKVNEVLEPLSQQAADPRTRDAAWAYTAANFDAVMKRLPDDWGNDALPGLFTGYCSAEKADAMEKFFEPRLAGTPGLRLGVTQLLENVRLCVAKKAAHLDSARTVFR